MALDGSTDHASVDRRLASYSATRKQRPRTPPRFLLAEGEQKRGGVLCFTGRRCSPPVLLPPARGRTESLSPRHWSLRKRDSISSIPIDKAEAIPQSNESRDRTELQSLCARASLSTDSGTMDLQSGVSRCRRGDSAGYAGVSNDGGGTGVWRC